MNRYERWLPISGLLAVVSLALTGFISPPPPIAGAPLADILDYYASHHVGLEAESVVDGIGVTLLVLFAATFHARIRTIPSLVAVVAAAIIAAVSLIEVAAFQALAYRPDPDPSRAALLSDFHSFAFQVSTFPNLLFLGAAAVAIFGSATLPNWLGWAAAVGGVLQAPSWVAFFAPPGPLAAGAYPDIAAFAALLAWLATCSLAMVSLPSLGAAGSGTNTRDR